ncbi:MAG: hypothetical protein AB1609_16010 [Bacillota bacterium]
MKVAEALIELRRLKRTRDMYNGLIEAASQTRRDRGWLARERRTTDTVVEVLYPGIDVNELRRRRNQLEDAIRRLETRIQKTNWSSGDPCAAELLREAKQLDVDEAKVFGEAKSYIRLYQDEIAEAPDVPRLIEELERLIDARADVSRRLQLLNWTLELQ